MPTSHLHKGGTGFIPSVVLDKVSIDQRVYSTYETGKRDIPLNHLITLTDFYHVTVDYLLGRKG